MIPSTNAVLLSEIEIEEMPSKDYRLHTDTIHGTVNNLEAMKQVVYKILSTERYLYPIYSWDYGVELADLYGEPVTFVCPELQRRIEEALLHDSRITGVDNFEFDTSKRHEIVCTFTVHTDFGKIDTERAVSV